MRKRIYYFYRALKFARIIWTWQPTTLGEALLDARDLVSLVAGGKPAVEPVRSWSIAPRKHT